MPQPVGHTVECEDCGEQLDEASAHWICEYEWADTGEEMGFWLCPACDPDGEEG